MRVLASGASALSRSAEVLQRADPAEEFRWRHAVLDPPGEWDVVAVTHPDADGAEAYRDEVPRRGGYTCVLTR